MAFLSALGATVSVSNLACAQTPSATASAISPGTTPVASENLRLASPAAAAASGIDPVAKATLDEISAAYQNAKTFKATLRTTFVEGTKPARSVDAEISFARPDKVVTTVLNGKRTLHSVADGTNIFLTDTSSPDTYQKSAADKAATDIAEGLMESHASMTGILPVFIVRPDAPAIVTHNVTSLKKLPDEMLDGVAVDVVSIVANRPGGQKATVTFAAGKDDHLLRRASMQQDADSTVTELYTKVMANPTISPTIFAFTPAANVKAVIPPPEDQLYDPRLKVGAEPLPLTGQDLNGKAQSVAAYRGKVLLLDFWATWCGPCLEELPNVVAAYDKYRAKGLNVLGVSLDHEGDRAKLVQFVTANKIPWPQIYGGHDFLSPQPKAYGVMGIPFMLLIGKDGKIAAVNPFDEQLEPAIEAALAK